jgi:putative membrane protein
MLWIKGLHIVFMVTWFAGLFYLPRLFVYHADCNDDISHKRFLVMEEKLFALMTIGALLTAVFGLWLLVDYAWSAYASSGWLHLKLLLVAALIAFHVYCGVIIKRFRENRNRNSHVFFRRVNEVPAILLIAIVLLAVIKPF